MNPFRWLIRAWQAEAEYIRRQEVLDLKILELQTATAGLTQKVLKLEEKQREDPFIILAEARNDQEPRGPIQ